jgi:hypothetical protein
MRLSLVGVLLVVAVLTAGCAQEPSAYKPGPTAKCLRGDGYRVTTDPAELGIVERNAADGGLIAFHPGNAIRMAFAANKDDAPGLEHAYEVFSSKKVQPHITDVIRTQKNAVLLWTVTPSPEDEHAVFACLKG